jgi:hypothetical protein
MFRKQFLLYVLVASFNAVVNYAVFAFLIFLKFRYISAALLASLTPESNATLLARSANGGRLDSYE